MTSRVSLPVLMPSVRGQNWSCHSCGDCCRSLVGYLFPADVDRLDKQEWPKELGVQPYVRMGRSWVLNRTADDVCVFLDDNGLCRIHSKFGESEKPLSCRIFPFSVRPARGGWQVSLRFDCPSVIRSQGRPLAHHRSWISELVAKLDTPKTRPIENIEIQPGLRAEAEEVQAFMQKMENWFRRTDLAMPIRLIGAARLTSTLASATLRRVRGDRFGELLELLFHALPGECASPLGSPPPRLCGLLRQFAFAHAEHVTLAEATAGVIRKAGKRWQQLHLARRFRKGVGGVPPLPGFNRSIAAVSFSDVESVATTPSSDVGRSQTPDRTNDAANPIEELLTRYVFARITGQTIFGEGYYGWPVIAGWGAFLLSMAAAGWLAKYSAVADGRNSIQLEDVARAIGIVDRAATRLPALATLAERVRITYCLRDDGVARLLSRYSLFPPSEPAFEH